MFSRSPLANKRTYRQYRTQAQSTASDAMQHIASHERNNVGLEIMAILHALP
jgi:hypothetical protein